MNQFDREEDSIMEMEASGEIGSREASRMLRELQRDYRSAAEESAREAYERELDRW